MAKKKAKKKVKKAVRIAKKRTRKPVSGRKTPKRRKVRKVDPYRLLLAKINRIRERVPYIEPTGECLDPDTGECLFRFTEAQQVFKIYRAECELERLHFRPYMDANIQPKAIAVAGMPLMIGAFCIEDLDTGARLIGWGSGMGRNRDWSGNTANTRALKQFLLTTFEATWEDPEKPDKQNLREEVLRELQADGTLEQIEQIKFWAQELNQGKTPTKFLKEIQDGTDSGKKHPNGDSAGGGSKSNRKGTQRHHKPGQRKSRQRPRKR